MKKPQLLIITLCVIMLSVLPGCQKAESPSTEEILVEMAQRYVQMSAAEKHTDVLTMLSGEQLSAMEDALPVLEASAGAIETTISEWDGKCDFLNRDKIRGSVVSTYVQTQKIPKIGTTTERLTVLYEFAKIADEWKIFSVRIIDAK